MNLEELRKAIYATAGMQPIHQKILDKSIQGENSVRFDYNHTNVPVEGKMNSRQAEILREDGYTIEYNRACLWYEVSGWDK